MTTQTREQQIAALEKDWATNPRWKGITRSYTAADVVRFLMQQGEMVTATQSLTDDMIELFAAEIGAEVRLVDPGEEQEVELVRQLDVPEDERDYDDLPERPPVITVMGLQFANLITGTIVVENVFYLPGLGRLIFQSIANRDLIVVRNCVMLLAAMVVVVNFVVDLLYAVIDPRIQASDI